VSDIFISKSKTGTGSAVAVYTVPTADSGAVPPVPPTTAIIKSIRLSNQTGGAVTTTVSAFDNSNSNLEIPLHITSLADASEVEVLSDGVPIVLEQQDAIKITGTGVRILISILEIT
jgi:hypothetical protein|tara:strand:+ start:117 stop:467 length:351 start_codon:yes stop_codon:yes gene_type:complete